MYPWKKRLCIGAALVFTASLGMTALAAGPDPGFSDVSADSWYADAVDYVRSNGLMSGTSAATFDPDGTMTRAMLAQTLYRAAGSPAAEAGTDFADEADISAYAAQAVDWARASGVVNGADGSLFLPRASATRAQAAVILRNYLTAEEPAEPEVPAEESRVLVAYFSATGNTERVANAIAAATGGDLFELTPVEPYTDADLNWTDEDSRVVYEYENPDQRDTELVTYAPDNWADYDVVFVGYPIWWYDAAWPVEGFVTENDFTGKTVIPFCTSSSSGIGESGERLAGLAGTGDWLEGERFRSGASDADVQAWIDSLGL